MYFPSETKNRHKMDQKATKGVEDLILGQHDKREMEIWGTRKQNLDPTEKNQFNQNIKAALGN